MKRIISWTRAFITAFLSLWLLLPLKFVLTCLAAFTMVKSRVLWTESRNEGYLEKFSEPTLPTFLFNFKLRTDFHTATRRVIVNGSFFTAWDHLPGLDLHEYAWREVGRYRRYRKTYQGFLEVYNRKTTWTKITSHYHALAETPCALCKVI